MRKYKGHRLERAQKRLEAQLESGKKTKKGATNKKVDLTDQDIMRIKKEIKIIKNRLSKSNAKNWMDDYKK